MKVSCGKGLPTGLRPSSSELNEIDELESRFYRKMQEVSNRPLVSIGLPVYNEERFLRETIESLLAQDFQDFELIISDNASSDGTEKICREFVVLDRRVRYERSEANRGAFVNFDRVFELASGKYF